MVCHIETIRVPEGGWVTKVSALPGLQIYGHSQAETLATARKLRAMLPPKDNTLERRNQKILAFYLGRPPESAYAAA